MTTSYGFGPGTVVDAHHGRMGCSAGSARQRAPSRARRRGSGSPPRRSAEQLGVEAALPAEPARQRGPIDTDQAAQQRPARRGARAAEGRIGRGSQVREPPAVEQFGHLGHQILRRGAPDGLAGHQDDVSVIRTAARPVARPPEGSAGLGSAGPRRRSGARPRPRPVPSRARQTVSPAFRAGGCPSSEHGSHPGRVHEGPSRRGGSDPWRGGGPGSCVRRGSACDDGSRASSRGGGCWVGTYAWTCGAGLSRGWRRRAATGRRARQYTGGHRRRTKGLTTERVSRPQARRGCGKPRCYIPPRLPPDGPPVDRRARRPSLPRELSTVVERFCG